MSTFVNIANSAEEYFKILSSMSFRKGSFLLKANEALSRMDLLRSGVWEKKGGMME
jgi:hypothetical protein